MGQDVAPPQSGNDLCRTGWGLIQVHHNRKACGLGDFQRHIEWGNAVASAGDASDTGLDANDQVWMLIGEAQALALIEQPQVRAFPDLDGRTKGKDACIGKVQKGKDSKIRPLDDVTPKAGKRARACASRIDQCGRP